MTTGAATEVRLHTFLNLTLYGSELSASRPGRLTSKRRAVSRPEETNRGHLAQSTVAAPAPSRRSNTQAQPYQCTQNLHFRLFPDLCTAQNKRFAACVCLHHQSGWRWSSVLRSKTSSFTIRKHFSTSPRKLQFFLFIRSIFNL